MRVINHLEALIEESGASQREIALAADISEGTFSRYIKGHVDSIKFEIEARLCRYFTVKLGRKISRDDIFSYAFDDEPESA
jgi:DNA transposition AAA+ family ATPase